MKNDQIKKRIKFKQRIMAKKIKPYMQREKLKITITDYLDFKQLFDSYQGTHKENRLFSLKSKESQNMPLLWLKENLFRVGKTLHSDTFSLYSNSLNSILAFISLLLGLVVGIGLLSYSGNEPINIIYYLFFAILLPLFSMVFTLVSLLSKWNLSEFFRMLFPFHWLEKVMSKFIENKEVKLFDEIIPKRLQKYIFIERLQRFSLIFSVGIVLAFIFMVITQDIAFAWRTTLQVDALSFYGFLEFIATPWRVFFPSLMPSLELVELSQYYRLGDKLDTTMIANANILGGWWQYLVMNTIFYAVLVRFALWLFAVNILNKKTEEEFFDFYGVRKLLREFKTPFIETKAPKKEKHLEIKKEHKQRVKKIVQTQKEEDRVVVQEKERVTVEKIEKVEPIVKEESIKKIKDKIIEKITSQPKEVIEAPKREEKKEILDEIIEPAKEKFVVEELIEDIFIEEEQIHEVMEEHYHSIIAWNFSDDEVLLLNDSKSFKGTVVASVGGSHSFEEDESVAICAEDRVMLYVKAWEPPTMDFVDFLEDLVANSKVYEIELFPIGLESNEYKATEKEFSIWNRKIEGLKVKKVWVIDEK